MEIDALTELLKELNTNQWLFSPINDEYAKGWHAALNAVKKEIRTRLRNVHT